MFRKDTAAFRELLGVVGPLILKEDTTMKTLKTSKGVWELCKLPIWGPGRSPAAYAFWGIFSSKSAPGGNIFYKRPKKTQLYRH